MTYYNISTAWEPTTIGVNNGICQAELVPQKFAKPDDWKEIIEFFDYPTYWSRGDHKPTKAFNFEYIKLLRKAKITDIMSLGP